MKAILLSIRPEWVVKILNGIKKKEIRSLFPKDYIGWVYIYCTKGKPYLLNKLTRDICFWEEKQITADDMLNGKVVARFWCDEVESVDNCIFAYHLNHEKETAILEQSCLTKEQMLDYLGDKKGYAIHISKLEIFDRPKELSEFSYNKKYKNCSECPYQNDIGYTHCNTCIELVSLTKAPQSFMYVDID